MASLRFPDNGSRYVFLPNGRPAVNARVYYHSDEALTVPAEIYVDVDGAKGALVAPDSDDRVSLRLDAFGGQRSFWGPVSGQDRLWVVVNGVVSAVDADYNARIDGVETRVTVLEGTIVDSDGVATAVAAEADLRVSGDAAVTAAAAADATDKAADAQAAAIGAAAGDATAKASAAQTAAINTAASDATAKVTAHTNASDPHGDRAAAATDATSRADAAQAAAIAAAASDATTKANSAQTNAVSAAATDATSKVAAEASARTTADNLLTPKTRAITAGTGLTGGGDLTADRTIAVAYGTTSGTAAQGNDTRLSDARTPTTHATSHATGGTDPITVAQSQVTGLSGTLAAKADLVGGLVPSSQIPPSSATYRGEVASESAMLALPAVKNDYARRTDTDPDTFWTLIGTDPTVLGNWLQTSSAGAVSSVNSQSGTVVLGPADVGAVPVARTVATTSPLTGGGALSGNLTLGVTVGTAAGTVAAGDAPAAAQAAAITASAQRSANLSDLGSASTARTNLGLGAAATRAVGTTSGDVAAGDAPAAAQAAAVQRVNHTGTQSADTLVDGTTAKAFLGTERTKLTGVAAGATANSTDAQLRDRSLHTGFQTIATITGLQTSLDGKVSRDSLVVNVEDYAVGNANYLSGGVWYADAGLTTVATNDTAAIRALVTAGARHMTFGSRRYRIQWTEGTSFLSWANANGITLEGHGAVLCDTGTYTVSPFNPYTPVFEFSNCANMRVWGIDYIGPAISTPLAYHGYVGASFVRAKNGSRHLQVDATCTNLRYGVVTGSYPTPAEGYNRDMSTIIRGSMIGYPIAHYLAEDFEFRIDVTGVHRVGYLAGCVKGSGDAFWKDQYVADTCLLISDATTGTGTSRGSSKLNVGSFDEGSTVFQASTTCAGIGLSRVDPGIVYEDITIRVSSTSTDSISSTVGGFKLYSGAKNLTVPPAPYDWEPSIVIRNVTVSGTLDHSAQTIEGNTAGDIFVRAFDTLSAHAATIENLSFKDLIIKQSSGNTRGLYLEAPGAIGNGITFDRVQAPGAKLNIYTPTTVPVTFINSSFAELVGENITPKILNVGSAIGATSGTIVAVEGVSGTIGGSGAFIRTKSVVLTLTGSAVSWPLAIPAGSLPLGLSGIITEAITGATGMLIGVGSDSSRYLNTNTTTLGFTFGPSNQAVTEQSIWWAGSSALNINVTAKGSNFTGGKIKLVFSYFEFPAPTA